MYFNKGTEKTSNQGLQEFIFALKECGKPEFKIDTTQHVLLNHTFNYPKNLVWQPIIVKMASVLTKTSSIAAALNETINESGYITPNITQDTQLSKVLSVFKSIQIIQIDGGDATKVNEIDIWTLRNAFITNIKFGNLTYSSEDLVDIEFTIVYDYAEHKINPPGSVETEPIGKAATAARIQVFGGEAEGAGVIINGIRGF